MADIFVSYAREDRDRVHTLANALAVYGWTIWWDREILAGKDFDEVIQSQLESAHCVVVVWSAASIASRWVKTEANEALDRRILIPISIDGVAPPLAFRNIQTVAFGNAPLEAGSPAFDDLVRALKSAIESASSARRDEHGSSGAVAVGRDQPGAPSEANRAAPKHPQVSLRATDAARTSRRFSAAAALLALAAAAGAYWYFGGRSSSEAADNAGAALVAGESFAAILDGLSVNIGTLKPRGIYDVVYETQPPAWRATGPVYPQGHTISNTDAAPDLCDPRKGALCIWGVAFRYDDRGQLFFVAGGDAALEASLRDQRVGRIIRGGLKSAIVAGETFVVLLDKLAGNIGTLTPRGRYEIAFLPKQRAWHASGPSYPAGTPNASTDPAYEVCAPEKEAFCIWGVAFRLTGDEVRFVAGGDAAQTDALRDQVVGRILR